STVAVRYFVVAHLDAALAAVTGADQVGEEVVARLGAVPSERLRAGHLVDGRVEAADDRGCERLRNVTDPEPDDLGLGMRGLEAFHAAGALGEEIARLALQGGV